jgi:hypothetical protein
MTAAGWVDALAGFAAGWIARAVVAEVAVRLALRLLSSAIGRGAVLKALGRFAEGAKQ